MRLLTSIFTLTLLSTPFAYGAPTQYSQGNPTDSEQYLLQQLNRARMDPTGEGQRLAFWLQNDPQGKAVVSTYGIDPHKVQVDFTALPPVPPLAFSADLIAAARSHSTDMANPSGAPNLGDGHTGNDGSTPDERVWASGFRTSTGADGYAGENYDGGAATLDEAHAAFLVDWGEYTGVLGHRAQAMSGSVGINFVGIGLANTSVNPLFPLVETDDFGWVGLLPGSSGLVMGDAPAVLTGVVYNDKNNNGQYDPGEGVAGVTVSVDGGAYYAVTTSSGGYSVPLVYADGSNVSDTVVVRMSGLSGEAAARVRVAKIEQTGTDYGYYRNNVEWDVVPGQSDSTSANPAFSPLASFLDGGASLGGNWYYLSFGSDNLFGYYNVSQYPYVLHDDLGWEYVQDANDGKGGIYFYDFASQSWFYTSPTFGFPYLYDFKAKAVLYYFPDTNNPGHYTSSPRYFYNYAAGKIVTL